MNGAPSVRECGCNKGITHGQNHGDFNDEQKLRVKCRSNSSATHGDTKQGHYNSRTYHVTHGACQIKQHCCNAQFVSRHGAYSGIIIG